MQDRCVREAVCATLKVKSYLIAYHHGNHRKQHNELLHEDKPPTTIATDTHFQQLEEMAETLKNIQLKIANCEATPNTTQEIQPKVTTPRTIVCWKCKQRGHYARGCTSNRQKRCQPSPTDKNIHNVPALSVNSVTSHHLQGQVSDVSVSFLVDTGAGVSLLNGHVWN